MDEFLTELLSDGKITLEEKEIMELIDKNFNLKNEHLVEYYQNQISEERWEKLKEMDWQDGGG